MTKLELLKHAADILKQNGIEACDFEAKELVYDVLSKASDSKTVSKEQEAELSNKLERRLNGEPLQYILGEWEFYGLPVKVGPGVLIPRPDTETVVDEALKILKELQKPTVFDLCAGSGCIGIALAHYGKAEVTFFEKSTEALRFLNENVRLNGIKAEIKAYDVLGEPPKGKLCDILVSNPPYIRSEIVETLSKEVKKEPKMALDGGKDGLIFYRHIARQWKSCLKPDGRLIFEIGFDQAEEVTKILETEGYKNISVTRDLGGNDRVVMGQKTV